MGTTGPALNVAVVAGACSAPAEVRTLPSGTVVAQLQVTTRVGGRAASVPVAVPEPKAWVADLDAGDEVVVVGHVRRRFFRAGGSTAARVEIEAHAVAPARDRRRVQALRRRADGLLAELET
jgi:single-strand DNA-binding protein